MRTKSLPLSVRATPRREPVAPAPRQTPPPRRLRDWLATIPILLLVPAILLGSSQVDAGTPTIQAPSSVEPGQTFTVTGSGFEARAKLQLVWNGSPDGMPRIRASSAGDFAAAVAVPPTAAPGPHQLAVVDNWHPPTPASNRSASASRSAVLATLQIQLVLPVEAEPAITPPPAPAVTPPPPTVAPTPVPTAVVTATPTAAPATPVPTSAPASPQPTAAPTASPDPGSAPPSATVQAGIWLSQSQIMALPTSGAAWERLVDISRQAISRDDLSCQDASAPQTTMATALVAARLNDNALRAKVRDELMRIMGTENGTTCGHPDRNRPLGVGRNLTAYVISADLIGFRAFDARAEGTWRSWLSALRSAPLPGAWALNSTSARADHSNWGAHQAAALTAADIYLGDTASLALDAAWARAWVDPTAPMPWTFRTDKHDYSWSGTGIPPTVPVNPKGASKQGVAVDGIPLVDMQRGGGFTTGTPVFTQYPREALVGRTIQFELLHRAGYNSYAWGSNGLLRIAQRLQALARQYDPAWYEPRINAYWILAARYGVALPREEYAKGRQVIGVDWSHRGP